MKFRVNGKDINDKDKSFIVVGNTEEECKDLIKAHIRATYIAKGPTIAKRINESFKNLEGI